MSQLAAKVGQAARLIDTGRPDEARALLTRLLPKSSTDPVVNRLMAEALLRLGQGAQALYYAQRASHKAPDSADALVTCSSALWAVGRHDEAVATVRRAVEIRPANLNARGTLINFLVRQEQYADAGEHCRAAFEVDPSRTDFAVMHSTMLLSMGRPEESLAILAPLRQREPGNLRVLGTLLPLMNYVPGADPAVTLAVAREYGAALGRLLPKPLAPPPLAPSDAHRPIKLAILSPDLRAHPTRFFIEPLYEHLDRARFSLTSYFTGTDEDEYSQRLRSYSGQWRHVPHLDPVMLAQAIRADHIDVLVDTAGHTLHQRLATMHLRPAPLQINFLGYPGTTGVPSIDLCVADTLALPPGAEAFFTERPMRLDPCHITFRPPPDTPACRPAPRLDRGHVTFGSFNTLMKLNDRVVALWSRLVQRVPGSRLVVKNVQLMQPQAQRLTRERFVAAGCPADRLDIRGHSGTHAEHLDTYSDLDIAVDTFPYNGATTTCEALLMGVPVVSIIGKPSPDASA